MALSPPPVTKTDALSADRFHENTPRGNGTCYVWRRNGRTQTWKTRPDEFRVPVKYGLHSYGYIDQGKVASFHTEANCPNR